ncbi:GNAT family N-acetyltransferase [Fructobacillus ficulneus]|uniref:GNAT family acetyltransferase n=1 Tax=Fructobacillus ficulneus TaxID=157463 RepID=A0A0K8MFI1_9LACO|nr:GNAT family N-acetyltransferase [Fructobacillus ficulneus]GAO99301.1 GNAT family acetyltransferase [Fructobacillus ficulneus]
MVKIRTIQSSDDTALHQIIQSSLKSFGLDIKGTAYFDPELGHLSHFYDVQENREYFVATSDENEIYGGAGIAEFNSADGVAELQKLYLNEAGQGQGLSYQLLDKVVAFAKAAGYKTLYLETHHKLKAAIHLYQKYGFQEIDGPLAGSEHSTMDHFLLLI